MNPAGQAVSGATPTAAQVAAGTTPVASSGFDLGGLLGGAAQLGSTFYQNRENIADDHKPGSRAPNDRCYRAYITTQLARAHKLRSKILLATTFKYETQQSSCTDSTNLAYIDTVFRRARSSRPSTQNVSWCGSIQAKAPPWWHSVNISEGSHACIWKYLSRYTICRELLIDAYVTVTDV